VADASPATSIKAGAADFLDRDDPEEPTSEAPVATREGACAPLSG